MYNSKLVKLGKQEVYSLCKGYKDENNEFDCDYNSELTCGECKYGLGNKDPETECIIAN